MSDWGIVERWVETDSDDGGCDETAALLHAYVDLAAGNGDAPGRYPRVVAHLRGCEACADEFEGLLAALKHDIE